MRKLLIVMIIFMIPFLNKSTTKATYDGVPLGESMVFHEVELQSPNLLKEIVILPETEFDKMEAMDIIKRLDLLPTSILQQAVNHQIKMYLFNGKLTEHPATVHLSGKVPKGYPETIFWDEVPGMGGTKLVHVKIGSSDKGQGHGSVNLEYHELAHSLQQYVYNDRESIAAFTAAWQKESQNLFPGRPYLLNFQEEYFAESFAYYFYSEQTRSMLKLLAPETFAFFSKL